MWTMFETQDSNKPASTIGTNSHLFSIGIRVCMDYLTLEKSEGGFQHILIITDHFTRYAQAIPTRNQLAKTTAEAFFNNFIIHYGIAFEFILIREPILKAKY